MFFSSGFITLLLYGLQACLAATIVPSPVSISDTSLAATPLQLPVTCSNDNGTHEQQESLQLLCSNYTLTTNNVSSFEFDYPVANTPYQLKVIYFGQDLSSVPLVHLYQTALNNLRWMVITGQRAVAPQIYQKRYEYPNRNGYIILDWENYCGERYGTYEELITIIEALETVTTVPGVMPPQYQNSSSLFEVYRHMGPGVERLFVGSGRVMGTPVGNEVE